MINAIRSIFFNLLFYTATALFVILLAMIAHVFGSKAMRKGIVLWGKSVVFIARFVMGITVETRGYDTLPKEGALIFAAKHQSNIDPALIYLLRPDVTALAKKELFSMPFMGTIMRTLGVISVDRGKGDAHKSIDVVGDRVVSDARPLLVYPEGTRVPVGERRRLKPGVFFIQEQYDLPVYTAATNAGYFWSKGFWHKPGTIVYEIHAPAPKGLAKKAFMTHLYDKIVVRSDQLMREAGADLPPLDDQQMRGKGKD